MPKAVMLVFTDPSSPDVEDEYNAWYENTHLADVFKAASGVKAATRYRLAESPGPGAEMPSRHLAVYEVEADDLNQVVADMGAAFTRGEMPMSDTLAVGPIVFFEQISERHTP
jgi:hypothetical protein